MYDLILFDLDGTLVNTIYSLSNAVNHSLRKFNMPQHTVMDIQSFVGNGILKLIERSVPDGTPKEMEKSVYDEFKTYYTNNSLCELHEYAGVKALVDYIYSKNIPMAVVTNKNHEAACKIIDYMFPGKFTVVTGAKEELPKKPNKALVELTVNQVKSKGYEVKNPVFIGDSEVDIQTGKNSGMDTVSVSWGFKTRDFLEENNAESIVDNTKQLMELLFQ